MHKCTPPLKEWTSLMKPQNVIRIYLRNTFSGDGLAQLLHWVHCWVVWLHYQPLNFLASSLCPYLSSTATVLATTSEGFLHWTRTTLSDRNPISPFILVTSSSVNNFSWYNSNSTVWDNSTDTQTGHTKHCYTMLIPKVYNVCGYTVTGEDTAVTECRVKIYKRVKHLIT